MSGQRAPTPPHSADQLVSWTTAQQGQRSGVHVQTSFKDLVPMAQRTDVAKDALAMERPSEDEVQATADRTKAALERLVQGKIKAAQPKNVEQRGGDVSYMRYTPQNGGVEKQKIIKMVRLPVFHLRCSGWLRSGATVPEPDTHPLDLR